MRRLARITLIALLLPALAPLWGSPAAEAASARPVPGLPTGVPSAALAPEPKLPTPAGWPFPEAFPRTSGTGRLAGGAAFWSDFVYDDHGATGLTVAPPVANLAPTLGTYVYPQGPARGNGADIFRAAIGLDGHNTYWRVDWTTLVDARVPVAEWGLASASTGASAEWPAGAGVSSPGLQRALVVSSRGAWLIDHAGRRVDVVAHGGALHMDLPARSFVVRVPRSLLPVSGDWRVRLVSGLANASGTAFQPVPLRRGALPGEPAVYNVTFRAVAQEPASSGNGAAPDVRRIRVAATFDGNLWNESAQARALTRGNVGEFSWGIRWSDLAARRSTPEPRPTGYSARWYVTTLNLGQGEVQNAANSPGGDLRPNFLSRIQPYSVYVPTAYDPTRATPLTWILHSLGVNHNQYASTAPRMVQQECEDRRSICATTNGFGPDGWYFDEAEVDFWQVWHQLALAYHLDPERTVISGYSMGGFASYKLALEYPDLFAKAMPLAGPPGCGVTVYGPVFGPSVQQGPCADDSETTPLVPNARWLPYVMADGAVDELVPITGVLGQVQAFTQAGNRYRFHFYPAEDHMVYAIQDGFSTEIAELGTDRRTINPPTITFTWYPDLTRADYGIGPTGAYWVRDLRARDTRPGVLARIDAASAALPNPSVRVVRQAIAEVPGDPTPDVEVSQRWVLGDASALRQELTLDLTNVAGLRVDLHRAGISSGRVKVTTDGRTNLRLSGLRPGTVISWTGGGTTAGSNGTATISLGSGLSLLRIG